LGGKVSSRIARRLRSVSPSDDKRFQHPFSSIFQHLTQTRLLPQWPHYRSGPWLLLGAAGVNAPIATFFPLLRNSSAIHKPWGPRVMAVWRPDPLPDRSRSRRDSRQRYGVDGLQGKPCEKGSREQGEFKSITSQKLFFGHLGYKSDPHSSLFPLMNWLRV